MTALIVMALAVAAAWVLPGRLAGARWTSDYPRGGIIAWALLFVATFGSVVMAGLSLLLHLRPLSSSLHSVLRGHTGPLLDSYAHLGGRVVDVIAAAAVGAFTAGSLLVLAAAVQRTRAARTEHLDKLALVAHSADDPDLVIVDTDQPAAYVVPGRDGTVVITTGARERLSMAEMDAVLAHERTHVRAGHHRLVTVTRAFAAAMPWLPAARHGHRELGALVEMRADDVAAGQTSPVTTASALVKLAGGAAPAAAMAMASTTVERRVERLLDGPRRRARSGLFRMLGATTGLAFAIVVSLAALSAPIAFAVVDTATCAHQVDVECGHVLEPA